MISRKQNIDFGIVLALVLLVIHLFIEGTDLLYTLAIVALLLTALIPSVYTSFSRIWYKITGITEVFISTLFLTLLFYLIVTPVGRIRKWSGKDSLYLRKFKKDTDSVFITQNKKYSAEDLENQF